MSGLKIERVVVTGGRRFTDYDRIEADLRALLPLGLRRVAEGQCPFGGADDLAYDAWHLLRNESTQRFPIDNRLDGNGKNAPRRRNVRMLEAEVAAGGVDLVLAYPDEWSRGTWHCTCAALDRGLTVAVWRPDGWPPGVLDEVVGKVHGVHHGRRHVLRAAADLDGIDQLDELLEVLGG